MNIIIKKDQSKSDLAAYLYSCCGSPPVSTFLKATRNGNLITWPAIDEVAKEKFLQSTVASAKGHLNQEKMNLQSTKTFTSQQDDDYFPTPDAPNVKTYESAASLIPFSSTTTAYQDLTGRFPHKSSRGNEYLLVVYDFDSNTILV